MDAADKFLRECVQRGAMSQEEYEDVSLHRAGRYATPEWVDQCYVLFAEACVRGANVSYQDCLIYANYPAWTQKQIAKRVNISQAAVCRALNRVRSQIPEAARCVPPRSVWVGIEYFDEHKHATQIREKF